MNPRNFGIAMSTAALMLLASAYGTTSLGAPAAEPAMKLTGAQEVPPVKTMATASSSIAVGEDMSVTGSVNTSGIEATMAHIHQGAMGVSGPVVVTLTKASATQSSVRADTKLTPEQYQSYKAGELYVNVHSDAHKNGEIRLQLKP